MRFELNRDFFVSAQRNYMTHLRTHPFTVESGEKPVTGRGDLPRASSLGRCHIADAYEHNGMEMTHAYLAPGNNQDLDQILTDGVIWESFWQNAVKMEYERMFRSWLGNGDWVDISTQNSTENGVFSGHCDVMLRVCGISTVGGTESRGELRETVIVEFKRSDKWCKGQDYILQVAAYMMAFSAKKSYIVVQHRPGLEVVEGYWDGANYRFGEGLVSPRDIVLAAKSVNETRTAVAAGQDVFDGIIPAQCCNESLEKLQPHMPKSGVNRGKLIPGVFTVKCPYAGLCMPETLGWAKMFTQYDETGRLELYQQEIDVEWRDE